MHLNLKDVFEASCDKLAFDAVLDLSEMTFSGMTLFPEPITVKGAVENHAGIITLAYSAVVPIRGVCDRCAEEFSRVDQFKQTHILVQSVNNEHDSDFVICENQEIDLDELAAADIVLGLPPKLLCREDCKGLCGVCGANMNLEPCDCLSSDVDPRLEKLKEFFE